MDVCTFVNKLGLVFLQAATVTGCSINGDFKLAALNRTGGEHSATPPLSRLSDLRGIVRSQGEKYGFTRTRKPSAPQRAQ